ncbi:MAG: hypothetical protein AB7V16_12660 [Vulcanibacillus sp.]
MKTITIISILLFWGNSALPQGLWQEGVIHTKSVDLRCTLSSNKKTYFVKTSTSNSKIELPFGTSEEKGSAKLYINSERIFYYIIADVFSLQRVKEIMEIEKQIPISFIVDEDGIPIEITFFIKTNTKIKPEELAMIERGLMEKIRFKIIREIPFGEPCVYPFLHILKFDEFLKGELKLLKRDEVEGKKYW